MYSKGTPMPPLAMNSAFAASDLSIWYSVYCTPSAARRSRTFSQYGQVVVAYITTSLPALA